MDKVEESIRLIQKGEKLALALNPDGYMVGFSGGKDSQVLLDLVKKAGVRYVAHYGVTTNDPPENVQFIRQYYPEVIFVHPKENLFKLISHKGLPTMYHRYCCAIFKEQIGAGSAVLTGVRAEESRKRAKYNEVAIFSHRKEHADRAKKHSIDEIEANEHRCIKGKDKLMLYPILRWTEQDVWDYIRENNLPINPCYKKYKRVGCMFCPFSSTKQITEYERRFPRCKQHILYNLQLYLDRYNEHSDKLAGITAEEYYEVWKRKGNISEYRAKKNQLRLF